jgi:hypothetical protein
VCSPSSSGQLSPSRRASEMIGENLLPTAQAQGLGRQGPLVAAPGTGNRHIDLLCYLWPGQALVTQFQDLLCRRGMSGRADTTHGDARATKLMTHGGPGNAHLGTDLAQGPALGVQIGCTLKLHGATLTISRIGFALLVFLYEPDHVVDLVDDSLGVVVIDVVPSGKDDVTRIAGGGRHLGWCRGDPVRCDSRSNRLLFRGVCKAPRAQTTS